MRDKRLQVEERGVAPRCLLDDHPKDFKIIVAVSVIAIAVVEREFVCYSLELGARLPQREAV